MEETEVENENNPNEHQLTQSRQPKRNGTVSFVVQEGWIIAKVIHKFKSDYYNVKLEDGEKLSVQSKLPTADYVQSWTLCDPELWQPTYQQQPEQLRTNQKLYNSVQSKDMSSTTPGDE